MVAPGQVEEEGHRTDPIVFTHVIHINCRIGCLHAPCHNDIALAFLMELAQRMHGTTSRHITQALTPVPSIVLIDHLHIHFWFLVAPYHKYALKYRAHILRLEHHPAKATHLVSQNGPFPLLADFKDSRIAVFARFGLHEDYPGQLERGLHSPYRH